ncbi:RNA-guided endonuclease InsQ/TnpB family protein [Salininema proteolyticum]|uniref:RNA-guided endonuclease InsQ/TnpB family protein n=1 Tax=Salininema proteolyticum TaxID=1607685 RepID=A0ABV8TXG2_9ACTN
MFLRYRFRLYPTAPQRNALARTFGCARTVYNDGIAARRAAYEAGEKYPSYVSLAKSLITEAKKTPERAWLGGVSAVVLQQALRDCDTAYRNFFDSLKGKRQGPRIGPPRFKRRSNMQTARFTRAARFTVLGNGRLRLPKVGDLKVAWSRELPSEPSSVTVVKTPTGKYFASFVVDLEEGADLQYPLPEDCETGIDLGLKSFAVLRGGKTIDSPKFFRRLERKLKKASRSLSRKEKGSANRAKARLKVAKVHEKIKHSRNDWIDKQVNRIVAENQSIYTEDLNVKGMARGRAAKSVADASFGLFLSRLESKAAREGRTFVRVDRFFPSTRLCSDCGALTGPAGLEGLRVRRWECGCGAVQDRDVNAEINIRREGRRLAREAAAGHAEAVNACGAQVRPAQRGHSASKQEPSRRANSHAGSQAGNPRRLRCCWTTDRTDKARPGSAWSSCQRSRFAWEFCPLPNSTVYGGEGVKRRPPLPQL